MRQAIRFRAFHHNLGRYIPVRTVICNEQGDPVAVTSGGLDARRYNLKDVTLERWTGRVDRCGNPVFEGDLIQRYIEPAHGYFYCSNITVVEWQETNTYTGWGLTDRTERRIEVVGNRHQDAHLLKVGVAA